MVEVSAPTDGEPPLLDQVDVQPHNKNKGQQSSVLSGIFNMSKGNMGSGLVTMPHAFGYGGLIGSWVVAAISIWGVVYAMLALIQCKRVVEERKANEASAKAAKVRAMVDTAFTMGNSSADYGLMPEGIELAELKGASGGDCDEVQRQYLSSNGPETTRSAEDMHLPTELVTVSDIAYAGLGTVGGKAVLATVSVLPLCFCMAFILIIMRICLVVLKWPSYLTMLVLMPILVLLSFPRYLHNLRFVSLIGSLIFFTSVYGVVVIAMAIGQDPAMREEHTEFISEPLIKWSTFINFAPIVIYSIESIMLVAPLDNTLKNPKDMNTVIYVGTGGIAFLNVMYACLANMGGFGECEVVTNCLPPGPASIALQMSLVAGMILSHPVQMFCCYEVHEQMLFGINGKLAKRHWMVTEVLRHCYRIVLVMITILVAYLMPDVTVFIGLIGGCFGSFIMFLFPSLSCLRLVKNMSCTEMCTHVLVIIGGILMMVYAGITGTAAIVEHYSSD